LPYKGVWLEKRRLGLRIHYRKLPESLLESLRAAVGEVMQEFVDRLRAIQAHKAWEIALANGWNKGTAIRLILADSGTCNDVLLYAGDGVNDSEVIEEVLVIGGITLGIGGNTSCFADYRLPNHAALLSFLRILDVSLEKQRPHTHNPELAAWEYSVLGTPPSRKTRKR
jgi:trehalose-phosphatase